MKFELFLKTREIEKIESIGEKEVNKNDMQIAKTFKS
jgi:hypothetical protein